MQLYEIAGVMLWNDTTLRSDQWVILFVENDPGSLFYVKKWPIDQSLAPEELPAGHFSTYDNDPVSFPYIEKWPKGHASREGHSTALHRYFS